MKKILILFLAILIVAPFNQLAAQSATDLLNKTAKKLSTCGGIDASFEATTYKGSSVAGTSKGRINIKGNKFKIIAPEMTVWFDGANQWAMFTGANEVNWTEPTNEELQSINPYTFVNLYKNGYNNRLSSVNYNGKKCHEVLLRAQSKNKDIQEMRIVIDPANLLPYSIRVKQGGNWTRIRVSQIKIGQKYTDQHFRFDSSKNPNIEVIDLR